MQITSKQTTPFTTSTLTTKIKPPKVAISTKDNPIAISDSQEKIKDLVTNSMDSKVTYDFIKSQLSPFSYDLSQLWNHNKVFNMLQLPTCSAEDSSFILQCLNQNKELQFSPILKHILQKKDLL